MNQLDRRSFFPFRKYPYLTEKRKFTAYPPVQYLNSYLLLVIAVNFLCVFMKSYGGDMDYWRNWMIHLANKGYAGFEGNYPPVYVHWLYVVGKFMLLIGQPIETNNFLKFLTQLPVMVAHLVLTRTLFSLLMHRNIRGNRLHAVMLLTVINPALLLNGPIWGQVDIVPVTFIVCALYLLLLNAHLYLVLPLFTLALLTKFQMICFAPVFGIVFFRDIRNTLLGCVISLILATLILLPLALTDSIEHIIRQAYFDTLGQYPFTTYNAANLWMLLTGNVWPDKHIFFGFQSGSIMGYLFTAKYLGMVLFSLSCLWVFFSGIKSQILNQTKLYSLTEAGRHVLYAMFCATAFFVLLPGMHERYLIPACVIALVYSAIYPEKIIYPILLTMVSFLNIAMIHGINGSDIWTILSCFATLGLLLLVVEMTQTTRILLAVRHSLNNVISRRYTPLTIFVIATGAAIFSLEQHYRLHQADLAANETLLTRFKILRAQQDYGKLHIDRNIDNKTLSIAGIKYASGIGTHANSTIVFKVPQGAETFRVLVGVDDDTESGEVIFTLLGDGRKLWDSGVIFGNKKMTKSADVSIAGIKQLTLYVDAHGENSYDHANWINPIIRFKGAEYVANSQNQHAD